MAIISALPAPQNGTDKRIPGRQHIMSSRDKNGIGWILQPQQKGGQCGREKVENIIWRRSKS